jgi:hypothetical protein
MPGRPGRREQPGYDVGEHVRQGGWPVQRDGVPAAYEDGLLAAGGETELRRVVADELSAAGGVSGDRQQRSAGKESEDRPADPRVQLAGGDRAGDQVEQPRRGRQQLDVGRGRAFDEEVGERAGRDVPPVGRQREGGEEQCGQAERLVAGRRRVDHGRHALRESAVRRLVRDGPAHLPFRPFLDRPVGQQRRLGLAVRLRRTPGAPVDGHCADGRAVTGFAGAFPCGGERTRRARVDDDLRKCREREHERGAGLVEQPPHERLGAGVPQGQPHQGVVPRVEAVIAWSGGVVRPGLVAARPGERQAQHRHVAASALQLPHEFRNRRDRAPRPRRRPGHSGGRAALVTGDDGGLVADGHHGGEADAEAARGGRLVAFGRGAERTEGLHSGGVQGGAGVRGGQHTVAKGEADPPRHPGADGRVGGVLGQLDDHAVAVAASRVVLLGVRVLAEPGRRRRPRRQDALANRGGAVRILHRAPFTGRGRCCHRG